MNDTEMKYKIVEFGSLSQEERQTRAEEISRITQEEPKMLSLSPQEVLDKEYLAFLVEKATDKVVSLVAISEPILNSEGRAIGEIGTMYTVPDHRGQGLAHILREHAENWARESEDYDGLCAFLCEESIRIFAEAGYSSKNATKVLPDNYFELCLDHCYLHEGAEDETSDLTEKVKISQARIRKIERYEAWLDYYESKDDEVSKKCLEILKDSSKRAHLCCSVPVYLFLW